MPTAEIQITKDDIKGLTKRLRNIKDPKAKNRIMRNGLTAGARVIRDRAKELAPIRYGDLQRDIIARSRRQRRGSNEIRATVTMKKGSRSARIAHLVEFGTRPHEIKKLKAQHPGARAKPFLRPAADESDVEVLDAIVKNAKKGLAKLDG